MGDLPATAALPDWKVFVMPKVYTPHQLCEDNSTIVLPLFLMLLHTKDIWCKNMFALNVQRHV